MLALLGISCALAAAGAAGVTGAAKPLDPKVEAALALVTDFKALKKLRGEQAPARLQPILPIAETRKIEGLWEFEGEAATGPIQLVQVSFDGPRLTKVLFILRTASDAEKWALQGALAQRLRAKLGKPSNAYQNKAARVAFWEVNKEWNVGTSAQQHAGVTLDVSDWLDEK